MKLLMSWEDIGTDHPDVPAKILFSGHGAWPAQEPPRRTVCNFTSLTFSCTIRTLPQSGVYFNNFFKTIFDFHYTGYGDGSLLIFFSDLFTDPFLSGVTGVFLRVRCILQQNSQ